MRGRPTSIFIVLAVFLVGGGSSFAQSSVGFAEPDSLAALTAYRLPDWTLWKWSYGIGVEYALDRFLY